MARRLSPSRFLRGSAAGGSGSGIALAIWLCLPLDLCGQERSYSFAIEGPGALYGKAGETVEAEFFCVLWGRWQIGNPGPLEVEGWAFGVEGTGVRITDITVVGTAAEPALTQGFERSELTSGPGNEGAISKVIYSHPVPRALPVQAPVKVARIKVAAVIPEGWSTAWLRPRDGLRGSIDTVETFVREPGGERIAATGFARPFNLVEDRPTARFSIQRGGSSLIVGQTGSILREELMCKAGGGYPSSESMDVGGWAIGLTADGAAITNISVAGTYFEGEVRDGFILNELTGGPNNQGAVSIVSLSPSGAAPVRWSWRDRTIARITIESDIVAGGREITVSHTDSLKSAAGTVTNHVLVEGQQLLPTLQDHKLYVTDVEPCGPISVGFSSLPVNSRVPFVGILGGSRAASRRIIPTPVAASGTATAYANFILTGEDWPGICCWSISVEVTGEASPSAVAFHANPGFQNLDGGFRKTAIASGERGQGRKGFVHAVVGNFDNYAVISPESTMSVIEMEVTTDRPQSGEAQLAELRFADGLSAVVGGPPVQNFVTVWGETKPLCNLGEALLALEFTPLRRFIRGDASNDLAVDLSDAIAILGALFGGDARIACPAAADANDSGGIDISDPIHLLSYLFLGGPPPSPPFPDCGDDETEDAFLGCERLPACP